MRLTIFGPSRFDKEICTTCHPQWCSNCTNLHLLTSSSSRVSSCIAQLLSWLTCALMVIKQSFLYPTRLWVALNGSILSGWSLVAVHSSLVCSFSTWILIPVKNNHTLSYVLIWIDLYYIFKGTFVSINPITKSSTRIPYTKNLTTIH